MTIEFECDNCGKLLKTEESRAGQRGKCPDCGEPIQVPAATSLDLDFPEDEAESFAEAPQPGRESAATSVACPMCGASVPASARQCPACGESLQAPSRTFGPPGKLNVGAVFDHAWARFKANMGTCVLALIAFYAVMTVGMIILQTALGVGFGAILRFGNPANPGLNIGAALLPMLIGLLVLYVFAFWLTIGYVRFNLRVVAGGRAEIGDLFAGENVRYLLRLIGNGLVLGLLVGFLAFCSMFLGAILAQAIDPVFVWVGLVLYFFVAVAGSMVGWFVPFVLVDQNPPGLGALTKSIELLKGNYLAVILLMILMGAINLVDTLMLLVGLLFSIPLTLLMLASAYQQMSGSVPDAEVT